MIRDRDKDHDREHEGVRNGAVTAAEQVDVRLNGPQRPLAGGEESIEIVDMAGKTRTAYE